MLSVIDLKLTNQNESSVILSVIQESTNNSILSNVRCLKLTIQSNSFKLLIYFFPDQKCCLYGCGRERRCMEAVNIPNGRIVTSFNGS